MRAQIFLIFILTASIIAQAQSLKFPGTNRYSKSIIYMDDENSTFYKAQNVTIINDSVTISLVPTDFTEPAPIHAHINDIYTLRISQGSKAGEYAIYGALLMAVSSLLAVADVSSDPYTEVDENAAKNLTIGFTIGGALVGGIIGSTKHKWKTIYQKEDSGQTSALQINYGLVFSEKAGGIMLNLSLAKL